MKIDNDCIRDILMLIEENEDIYFELETNNYKELNEYTAEQIIYHVKYCDADGMLNGVMEDIANNIEVKTLSPNGHKILEIIKKNTAWNKIKKEIIPAARVISVSLIPELVKFLAG